MGIISDHGNPVRYRIRGSIRSGGAAGCAVGARIPYLSPAPASYNRNPSVCGARSSRRHALNALDKGLVLTGDEGEGVAGLCSAAGTADAVRISIRRIGDVIVDDMGYAQDIDAPGRDIGGHQDLVRAVAETVERILALVLRQVPLQRAALYPAFSSCCPTRLARCFVRVKIRMDSVSVCFRSSMRSSVFRCGPTG